MPLYLPEQRGNAVDAGAISRYMNDAASPSFALAPLTFPQPHDDDERWLIVDAVGRKGIYVGRGRHDRVGRGDTYRQVVANEEDARTLLDAIAYYHERLTGRER